MFLALAASAEFDYSPCTNEGWGNEYIIRCTNTNHITTKEILEAFRRNRGNADITSLTIYNAKDMTDDVIDEILDILSASVAKLTILGLVRDQLTRVPEAVQKLTALEHFSMSLRSDLTVLPAGSLIFPYKIKSIIFLSGQLEVIQPGALQGIHFHYRIFWIVEQRASLMLSNHSNWECHLKR